MAKLKRNNFITVKDNPNMQLKVKYGMMNSVIDDSYLELKLKSSKVNIDAVLKTLLTIH